MIKPMHHACKSPTDVLYSEDVSYIYVSLLLVCSLFFESEEERICLRMKKRRSSSVDLHGNQLEVLMGWEGGGSPSEVHFGPAAPLAPAVHARLRSFSAHLMNGPRWIFSG